MKFGEEYNLRGGQIWDPGVKGADTSFWHGDTANPTFDSVKNALKIGDSGLQGSISSYNQYLFGDFEFTMAVDSLSPDVNDSEKYFGLRNLGDTLNRGAAFFNLSNDSLAGDSSPVARPFRVQIYDEAGNKQQKYITWDTSWGGGARLTRFRISWESNGYDFLINDTVYATLGDRPATSATTFQVNTTIPQALRLSNRSLDTSDSACTTLKFLNIRNSRMINPRVML